MTDKKFSDLLARHLVSDAQMEKVYADPEPLSYADRMTKQTEVGALFLQKNMLKEAVECFYHAFRENPKDFWVNNYLGAIAMEANDPASSNYFLNNCLEEAPHDWIFKPMVLTNFASCQFKLGYFNGAEESLEEAIKLNPELDKPYYMKAVHNMYLNRPNAALSEARRGLEMTPDSFTLRRLELSILEVIQNQKRDK
ncbi:MAG: hypothetical protein Q8O89_04360 [Nanoarchaeota archaeon]|nr:hypothetical protein [Nanoarchaeota archaeon]